jgi:hypothetical protein
MTIKDSPFDPKDRAFLMAALEGLQLQKTRIDDQIRQVKGMIAELPRVSVRGVRLTKRELSPAGRRRIADAQRRRWEAFRREKAATA